MATKELDYSVITQRVDCVFGHDHYITVKIREDNSLDTIYTTCSSDKEETEGLILLGTDPMKTCLGYMDVFLRHVKGARVYDLPNEYRHTFLSKAGEPISGSVVAKTTARKAEAKRTKEEAANLASEGLVERRLRDFIAKAVGVKVARKFSIIKGDDDRYTFNIVPSDGYNYSYGPTQPKEREKPVPIADRRNGEWIVRYGWEEQENVFAQTGRWGGDCVFCGVDGNSGHNGKKNHIKKVKNGIFRAMQASSQAGIRIIRDGVLDKDGEPVQFKYRANSKNLIGVRLPAPISDYEGQDDGPTENTSY